MVGSIDLPSEIMISTHTDLMISAATQAAKTIRPVRIAQV